MWRCLNRCGCGGARCGRGFFDCCGGCGRLLNRVCCERRIGNDLPALIVDVPCQHIARTTSRFKEPAVKRIDASSKSVRCCLRPSATFKIPSAELCFTDLDCASVIGCDHKLNRVVCRDSDVARVVNHKVVCAALLEWFASEVAVDVVLDLVSASRVDDV